jgi:4-oxalocrotonate tautomerase family enzyme
MPLVEINLVKGELSEGQKVKMANAVSDLLMDEIPNLPKEAISVIFYENPSENWIVGGKTVKELKQRGGT